MAAASALPFAFAPGGGEGGRLHAGEEVDGAGPFLLGRLGHPQQDIDEQREAHEGHDGTGYSRAPAPREPGLLVVAGICLPPGDSVTLGVP